MIIILRSYYQYRHFPDKGGIKYAALIWERKKTPKTPLSGTGSQKFQLPILNTDLERSRHFRLGKVMLFFSKKNDILPGLCQRFPVFDVCFTQKVWKFDFFLTALIWERESPRPYLGQKNYCKMPFQIRAAFLARPYLENDGS